MQPVDLETADEPRRMSRHSTTSLLCESKTRFVVVEALGVAGDAGEFQDPLRAAPTWQEELEGITAEGVPLTECQEPADLPGDGEVARSSHYQRRASVARGHRDDGRAPRRKETA
jgi:hypothetical protein